MQSHSQLSIRRERSIQIASNIIPKMILFLASVGRYWGPRSVDDPRLLAALWGLACPEGEQPEHGGLNLNKSRGSTTCRIHMWYLIDRRIAERGPCDPRSCCGSRREGDAWEGLLLALYSVRCRGHCSCRGNAYTEMHETTEDEKSRSQATHTK